MKLQAALFTLALLTACSQAPSNTDTTASAADNAHATTPEPATPATAEAVPAGQPVQDMNMSDAKHKATTASKSAAPTARPAMADGTVESVDAKTGKITIAHGPVDALQWPAMTMAFKATPEQVASVKAGDKVHFEFVTQGMAATITRIGPAD